MSSLFYLALLGFIKNERGEVLLAKRFDLENPEFHHKWQLPGGGLEKNETFTEALIREVKEETGLTVKPLSQRPSVAVGIPDREGKEKNIRFIILGYPCKTIGGILGKDIDQEISELKWFKIESIPWGEVLSGNREIILELAEI